MTGAALDGAALARALRTINAARARPAGESGRLEGLLRGLEEVLSASEDAGLRDRDGGRALEELDELLAEADGPATTRRIREFLEPLVDELIEALLDRPAHRLAAYGSLRPGRENHAEVADLVGTWRDGVVRGVHYPDGGEATSGFPGLVWNPEGDEVPVEVFESPALAARWSRLDEFEGLGYRRVLAPCETTEGIEVCYIYEIASQDAARMRDAE